LKIKSREKMGNRVTNPINKFFRINKAQMSVVIAVMLVAILLATTVFFWRTSEGFSKSYSENIDKKSYENIATYLENVITHNEIAWIEKTLVETNITIPLKNDGINYIGENELFKITYINPNLINISSKNPSGSIVDSKDVVLNTRFYVDGDYFIYSNPTIESLKDKNIIGDFFYYKLETQIADRNNEYIVYLTPTFKTAIIGNAGQPPESLAKSCYLVEYPKTNWREYYDYSTNTYSVYPFNYYIVNVKDEGIDGRYISYYTNIIIPSNSSMLDALSQNAVKSTVQDYIKNGGSLIMFSQNPQEKKKYDFLPTNIIFDKSYYDTVGVSKSHNITSNIYPYELAGIYFSAEGTITQPYFDSAADEILLRETPYGEKNNNNPSLILSKWGSGKVVVTTIPLDINSVLDKNVLICPWWDDNWHFRRSIEIDPNNVRRINEPIEVIIDPTEELNALAKAGIINLGTADLDFDSPRVIEYIAGDCFDYVEIQSQVYNYRPNMESSGYKNSPIEFHKHTISFELASPSDIKLEMKIPAGSEYKDIVPSIDTDFTIIINGTSFPMKWDPYDGNPLGGETKFNILLNSNYFNSGDNNISIIMDTPPDRINTIYENVLFSLYEHTSSGDRLFFKEFPKIHVYFPIGATDTPSTKGAAYSRTLPNQKRYYDIYYDIVENGPKPVPNYRMLDNSVSLSWSLKVDDPYMFPLTVYNGTTVGVVQGEQLPRLMNVSSPTTGDINDDGIMDIVIGLRNGKIEAINGTDRSTLWQTQIVDLIPYIDSNKLFIYAPVAASNPAITDLNHDDNYEIVAGGANILTVVTQSGSKRSIEISTEPTNVSIIDASTGTVLWKFPILGSMLSSPAIGDLDNDGYEDIIVVDTFFKNVKYDPSEKTYDKNSKIFVRNNIYAYSGRTQEKIFEVTGNIPSFPIEYFGYRDTMSPYIPYIYITTNAPIIADLDGNGLNEVAWGAIDGTVYAYQSLGNNWRKMWQADLGIPTKIPSRPLSYFISTPSRAKTDYTKSYYDLIVSAVSSDRDNKTYLKTYIIDGLSGEITLLPNITSDLDDTVGGHPIVHSPNGFHLRGGQVIIPSGKYLMFQYLDANNVLNNHYVKGEITQSLTPSFTYATPAIGEINNYTAYSRGKDAFFSDIVIGAENGKLYALSYRDTTSGIDNGVEGAEGNDNDKLHKIWEYSVGSPIRSAVNIDDIDNDGKLEIVFMSHDGMLRALNVGYNYARWNYARHDYYGTGNTETNVFPVSFRFYDPEELFAGDSSDPYDDNFRILSEFDIGAPFEENNFGSYVTNNWIKIDTNHNDQLSDELVIYTNDLFQIDVKTNEGKIVTKTFALDSIEGDVIIGDYIVTFLDRGGIKLFDNIMAYTSAPTRNIQIEEGIWVNLDIPNEIGEEQYIIQGLGDSIRIYNPQNPSVEYVRELRGTTVYGTISSASKNKYVVITSYGAYLSPNPQVGS